MAPNPVLADPTVDAAGLLKRDVYCPSGYTYSNGYCYSRWDTWGRWIVAAVLVVLLFVFLVLLSISRRRRRRGQQPMYGTSWMAPGGPKPGYYNNQNMYQPPPPPQYSAQPQHQQYTGTTFSPNDGYYGNHEGIELQQPANSYHRDGENVYAPPAGPPPGKK